MINFGLYLFKVSVCSAAFYALYIFLFKDYTFFRFNRYYLLLALLASFIIPALEIPLQHNSNLLITGYFEHSVAESGYDGTQFKNLTDGGKETNYSLFVFLLYWAGVIISLSGLGLSVIAMIDLKRNSEAFSYGKATVVKAKISRPYSFFNKIFLPESGCNSLIVGHEYIHVEQRHWLDLILIELAAAILWFNPLMIIYKRAVKLQHEYLADQGAIGQDVSIEQYLNCMLYQVSHESRLSQVSQFYSKPINKRIMMITKNKTPRVASVAYLLILPIFATLLLGFSAKPIPFETSQRSGMLLSDDEVPSIVPVKDESVTLASNFGYRIHPFYNKRRFHTGVDFTSKEGIPVVSTASGVVTESRSDSLWGNYVIVKHSEMYATSYSHLKSASSEVGDILAKGQTIGYVGSTGLSTAPHLHYEVLKNGKPVDPAGYFPKAQR